MVRVLRAVLLLLLMMGGLLLAAPGQAEAATVVISVTGTSFPAKTNVSTGDTVRWEFLDTLPHTTTACGASCSSPTPTPLWNSGIINQGGSFERTFSNVGTYPYYCQLHGTIMAGEIVVSGPPVGGVAELADPSPALLADESSGSSHVKLATLAGAGAAGAVLMAGAAWYTRRRLVR